MDFAKSKSKLQNSDNSGQHYVLFSIGCLWGVA